MQTTLLERLKSYLPNKTLHVALDQGERDQPTVIFLHGIASSSETWRPIEHKLDYSRYRVIAIDLLGFGGSPNPGGAQYTAEEHCDYIRRTLLRLKVTTPFTLVGHSMGSILSVHYATRWPDDVERLVLASLPLYIRHEPSRSRPVKQLTDMYMGAYRYFRGNREFTISGARAISRLFQLPSAIDVTEENWDAFRLSLQNTIENQNTYQELEHITKPTTIIVGKQDEVAVGPALDMANKFDHVELKVIPMTGHIINARMATTIADTLQKS